MTAINRNRPTLPRGPGHHLAGRAVTSQAARTLRPDSGPCDVEQPRPPPARERRCAAESPRPRTGTQVDEAELIGYLKTHIARFKVPRSVAFVDELPRTSTGKTQKFELREKEWAGHASRIQG